MRYRKDGGRDQRFKSNWGKGSSGPDSPVLNVIIAILGIVGMGSLVFWWYHMCWETGEWEMALLSTLAILFIWNANRRAKKRRRELKRKLDQAGDSSEAVRRNKEIIDRL